MDTLENDGAVPRRMNQKIPGSVREVPYSASKTIQEVNVLVVARDLGHHYSDDRPCRGFMKRCRRPCARVGEIVVRCRDHPRQLFDALAVWFARVELGYDVRYRLHFVYDALAAAPK